MKIKTNSIIEFLKLKLNKNIDEIRNEDFNTIDTLLISSENLNGSLSTIYEEDILNFKNLKTIIFDKMIIKESYISILNNLKYIDSIIFDNCTLKSDFSKTFKNLKLKKLVVNRSQVENYNFIGNLIELEELSIIAPQDENVIELDFLKNLINLKKLVLELCIVEKLENLKFTYNLELLSLLRTSIIENDFKFINNLKNLKLVYLNEEYKKFVDISKIVVKTDTNSEFFDII